MGRKLEKTILYIRTPDGDSDKVSRW